MWEQLYASSSGWSCGCGRLIAHQALVGKETAKVGQGKAMKERWIVKDKDTLKANVRGSNSIQDTSRC